MGTGPDEPQGSDWTDEADDKVVALIRYSARGKGSGVEVDAHVWKGSGVEVDAHVWNLWTFRDGELVEFKYFGDDRAVALEAPGLRE